MLLLILSSCILQTLLSHHHVPEQNNALRLYDEQLEQQLLGSILIENKVLQLIELQIKEGTFYFETNRRIFAEIKKLLENNKQADEKVLFYSLVDSGIALKNEELKQYISNLVDVATTATTNPKEIVQILNFLQLKRELVGLNQNLDRVINTSSFGDIENKIGEIEQQIYGITSNQSEKDSNIKLDKYTSILKGKLEKARKSNKAIQGVRTDFTDIDQITGGFQKGDLIIIAARPSMGKTALVTAMALNAANILNKEAKKKEEKQSVAVFSLEMSGEQLAARIVSMRSKYSTKTIHTGRYDAKDEFGEVVEKNKKISDAEWLEIQNIMQEVGELPMFIDDTPALNISLLRSRARYLKRKHNICAIFIDYLQLLRPSKSNANRVLEIAEITSTLKAIAKELDIPVVALSQLSRAVEGADRKDKRPQLSDLRESGTIEQDADIVMMLYREAYYEARKEPKLHENSDDNDKELHAAWLKKYDKIKNLAEVIVAKNRNGQIGTVHLYFDPEHVLFSNAANSAQAESVLAEYRSNTQKSNATRQNMEANARVIQDSFRAAADAIQSIAFSQQVDENEDNNIPNDEEVPPEISSASFNGNIEF